jgi:hypothetical protein
VVGRGRAAAREAPRSADVSQPDAAQPLQSAVQPN